MIREIRVLHVDDDPAFADVAGQYLERQDERITVQTATSAEEGLEELTESDIDCLISDHDMPGKNGIEFLNAVRESDPELPFILYTGKGSEEVASEAISSGVTDYLQKGSKTSQYEVLANRVINAVNRFHTQEELARSQGLLEDTEQLADTGGWEADVETGEQRWTKGTYRIHGIDPDSEFDPTVDSGVKFYHPEDRDTIERRVERCKEQGEPFDVELRLRTADDRLRWVRAKGEPVRKDGDIVKIRGTIRDVTERKEREQEITRLNHTYHTILSNIRETVLVTDDDGQFTYICPNVHFIFGYDAEEVGDLGTVGALFGERLIEPDELEAHGDVTNVETTITDSGGDSHTVLVSVQQADIEDGTRLYSIRDITERKERERRYNAVFNQTYQFTGLMEPDGTLLEANETALEVGDLEREAVIGKKIWDAYWFQHSDGTSEQIRDAVGRAAAGDFVRFDFPIQGADEDLVIDFSIRPITDDDGEVTLLIPEGLDITDRKEREQELQLFRQAVEASGHSIYFTDRNGVIEYVNPAFEEITGYSAEEAIGMTPRLLKSGEHDMNVYEQLWETILSGEVWQGELTNNTKTGERYVVDQTIAPIEGESGEITHFVAINRDVTEEKAHQE